MRETRKFPGRSESVREARRFVTASLKGQPIETVEAAALMVSELATNCVRHAHSDFEIAIETSSGRSMRIEALDAGPGHPEARNPSPSEPTGRGLRIVEALSDRWGIDERPGGKTVWFEIALQASASAEVSGAAVDDRAASEATLEKSRTVRGVRRRSMREPRMRAACGCHSPHTLEGLYGGATVVKRGRGAASLQPEH
jgi:anti-sigma regulatory factor (Ser/Thr protein kinase)